MTAIILIQMNLQQLTSWEHKNSTGDFIPKNLIDFQNICHICYKFLLEFSRWIILVSYDFWLPPFVLKVSNIYANL